MNTIEWVVECTPEIIKFIDGHNYGDQVSTTMLSYLKAAINIWNEEYRKGNSLVDDAVFDRVVEILEEYGEEITDTHAEIENSDRKQKLPIVAASMNKCKTVAELREWAKKKDFDFDSTKYTISPKYDGITLVKQENTKTLRVWTKGRDGEGLFVPEHYKLINHGGDYISGFGSDAIVYSRGEAIMKKSIFAKKYDKATIGETGFENPRNMVSGKFTDKDANEALRDIDYIRFHIDNEIAFGMTKAEQFDILNEINASQIPYTQLFGSEITEERLKMIFTDWASGDHEIDGLIIDIDSPDLRKQLGFETSSQNPCFARAFKGSWEDYADTEVLAINRQVDKQGHLNPVVVIKPVRLNGVTVNNVYADNERWIMSYGIGVGTKLTVKRSGMVIPRIAAVEGIKVLDAKAFNKLFRSVDKTNDMSIAGTLVRNAIGLAWTNYVFPTDCGEVKWNDGRVELMLVEESDDIKIQKNIAFFEIISADGISDGKITELWAKGFKTIPQILYMAKRPDIMASWEGWGTRSAELFCSAVTKAMDEVKYTKLMHATGFFGKLGSKTLDLVQHFDGKPTLQQLIDVKGIEETYANAYLNGYDKFQNFIAEIGYTPKQEVKPEVVVLGDKCKGWKVTFTGVRSVDMEQLIIQNGGEIKSGISKGSTHLIMKEIGSGSSKEKKAMELGCEILTLEALIEFFD